MNEHVEAATQECQPVLWHVSDLTGDLRYDRVQVSEHSTVANLIGLEDGSDRILVGLRDRLGVPVEYTDTLVHVARRYREARVRSQS